MKEDLGKQGSQSWEGSLATKTGREKEMVARRSIPCLAKSRTPRVRGDGDDVEMFDPKAAVLEMLKKPRKETWSDNLERDGDVSAWEEATKNKQETNLLQADLSITEKKKNRDRWRKGMLESLMKEKVAVDYWGDVNSENFRDMLADCAPHGVRVAVIKDLGFKGTDTFLFTELMKFYDKG